MLFFVDETWQNVAGTDVGALGAVALPYQTYNRFCREVFTWKKRILQADELNASELKGQTAFAKACFKREDLHGDSWWLAAARELFKTLERFHGQAFVVWTKHPDLLTLRNPSSTALSDPYKALLYDLRARMRREKKKVKVQASLNFDQREIKQDEATACAVSNYLARARGWSDFQIVPNFTPSSISPGLQAADVVAYLGAHQADRTARPELQPFFEKLDSLIYTYHSGRSRKVEKRCLREVV